jgi:Protein of unknown function DUF104
MDMLVHGARGGNENAVLRPLEQLGLDEHRRVTIAITEKSEGAEGLFDAEFMQCCAGQSGNAPDLEEVGAISFP